MSDCGPSNVCGTGNWSGPLPGDPDNNSALSAVGTYGGIDVSWTYPATNPAAVAHVEVYRSGTNVWSGAMRIAIVNGERYFDAQAAGTTYYYWIRIVSVNGTVGDPIGPASAEALPKIAELLALLTAQIDAGHLATALRNEVDAIPINRAALDQEVLDRIAADEIIELSVSDVQDGIAQSLAFIAAETTARTTETSALASQIDTVAVGLGDDIAVVEVTATASLNKANALGALYHVRVGVNGLSGGFGIYNDGSTVEAGFDVDTFWVGRTGPDKIKPFIVSGGVVYISSAVIQNATIDIAKINLASFNYLSSLKANLGDITAGNLTMYEGYAGSWSYMRSRAAKWFNDGVTGFISAGYGPTGSYFFDVTAGTSYIRMASGASIGEYSEISLGNGKFVANSSGAVIADQVDIRRRVVLENGSLDPVEIIAGTFWNDSGGGFWDNYPVGTVFTGRVAQLVLTSIYDANVQNASANQPYYAAGFFDGATLRSWSGAAGTTFQLQLNAYPMVVRTYSNDGSYAADYRLAIVFEYTVKLTAGSFTSFRLPTASWTLYKL